jgi:hypothetical protein
MSKITYKQVESDEILCSEESDITTNEYISIICEENGWNLEEIFDLEDGEVIVFVNQIL